MSGIYQVGQGPGSILIPVLSPAFIKYAWLSVPIQAIFV